MTQPHSPPQDRTISSGLRLRDATPMDNKRRIHTDGQASMAMYRWLCIDGYASTGATRIGERSRCRQCSPHEPCSASPAAQNLAEQSLRHEACDCCRAPNRPQPTHAAAQAAVHVAYYRVSTPEKLRRSGVAIRTEKASAKSDKKARPPASRRSALEHL